MALPLLWLGAAAASAWLGNEIAKEVSSREGRVDIFPGGSSVPVRPINGTVVCCGIYNMWMHTGIWVDDHVIELAGSGLIRAVSPLRFLAGRSGEQIFIACDGSRQPVYSEIAEQRAASRLYQYVSYDLIDNNCHQFVAECLGKPDEKIIRFGQLNAFLAKTYGKGINWFPLKQGAI